MKTTVRQLTLANIHALRVAVDGEGVYVDLGRTVATFKVSPADALNLVLEAQRDAARDAGTRGGIYASLHAVVRKLRDAREPGESQAEPVPGETIRLTQYVSVSN